MLSSTPRGKKKSRIDSIRSPLRLSVVLSPLRGSPAQDLLTDKDDEEERRARKETFQRASMSRHSNSIHLNQSFVNKQYDMCKALFMENKITIKNAWDLPIIDMLQEICNPSRPNFLREAGMSIDIGSRVYSLRVDYVHSEGMKLAKNMARVTTNDAEEAEQEEGGGNNEPNKKRKRPKRRCAEGVKPTIVADPKTLLASFSKLDPVDFMMRGDSESGRISGLFTRKLKQDDTTFITLDKEKLFFPSIDESPLESIPMKNIPTLPNPSFKFLGALQDFRMDQQKSTGLSQSIALASQQPVIFDDDGIPMHDNDDANVDHFFEDNTVLGDNDVEMENAQPKYITNFYQNFASSTSEYTFKPTIVTSCGQVIDKFWAGPSHWKLKGIKRSAVRFTGVAAAPNRRRKVGRKSDVGPIENFVFNLETYAEKPGSKSKTLRKRKGVDPKQLLLPLPDPNLAELVANYDTLFYKPGVRVSSLRSQAQPQEASGSHDDDNHGGSSFQNNDISNDHGEAEVARHDQDYDVDDLVDMPTTVSTVPLNFVRKSKYTNVKKLKDIIWKELSSLDADSPQVEQITKPIQPTTFSEIYQAVIKKEKQNRPSPHITFMAILHLANEKCLKLDPIGEDYKNFVIRRHE